jgi:hypothetical protein
MSTYEYRPNGPKTDPVYKIGIRDHVGRQKTADISTFALIVPHTAHGGSSWGRITVHQRLAQLTGILIHV